MLPHHEKALGTFLEQYTTKPEFIGILLAGSLAHNCAKENSDIDIMLVATESEFSQRVADKKTAFSLWDICDYPNGYIDCKMVSLSSMRKIAERGSDPARYAFKDSQLLHSTSDRIAPLIDEICRYPVEAMPERRRRFACQLLAWKWYLSQGEEKKNPYLIHLSCQKFSLFACRLILNENQLLYPFHKWMLRETQRAEEQPREFQALLETFLKRPGFEVAEQIAKSLFDFLNLDEDLLDWPNQFMADSELNWLHHEAPIDDL